MTARAGLAVANVSGTTAKRFIYESLGAGACWLDYDRDGRLDLFLVQGRAARDSGPGDDGGDGRGPHDLLYRAAGGGRFEERSLEAGLREHDWGQGCAVGDIDADGWPDLYVTGQERGRLWRNRGDGTFTDFTLAAGVAAPGLGASAAFADLDGDGDLDLFVTRYLVFPWDHPPLAGPGRLCVWRGREVFCGPKGLEPAFNAYYRNRGDGSFEDATEAAGFRAAGPSFSLGVIPLDFDRDGRLDLFVANDSRPNQLWWNRGDGRFAEQAIERGAGLSADGRVRAGMGVAAGDFDGDGWPDLFVTNFSEEGFGLYRNQSGTFADVAVAAGVAGASLASLGWGAVFGDLDRDGDLDLLAACGHVYPEVDGVETSPPIRYRERPLLLLNPGPDPLARFEDRAEAAGLGAYPARGLALADYDDDGDLDVLLAAIDAPPVLLENRTPAGPARHWLGVALEGRASARDGSGAVVTVSAPGAPGLGAQRREATAAGSYASSADPRLLFGVGGATEATLEARWPSGASGRWEHLAVDRYYRLAEGEAPVPLAPPSSP